MRGLLLQPWVTIQCTAASSSSGVSFTQDDEGWLDLADYADAQFWIDVTQVTAPSGAVQLFLETSPSMDDDCFMPVAPAATLTASSSPLVTRSLPTATTVPFARWLRWRLALTNGAAGAWGATFRIRAALSRQSFFVPTQLPGCQLWLRSDLGITFTPTGGDVAAWADQGPSGDSNRTLQQSNATVAPSYTSSDSSFNGQPSLGFVAVNGQFMTSGTWSQELLQPNTWVYMVSNTGGGPALEYLQDSNDATTGQQIVYTPTTPLLEITAHGSVSSVSSNNSFNVGAAGLLCEWNGSNSTIYQGNFTTPIATGTVGSGGQGSMTLGGINGGTADFWQGGLAEVLAFSGILTPSQKGQLRRYFNARYNTRIT